MSKTFLLPGKTGNIRVAQIIEKFTHRDVVFVIHLDEQGCFVVAHHLSGRAAHVETDLEACKSMAIKKLDKAMDNGFDFEKYTKLNTPKNIKTVEDFLAILDRIRENDEVRNEFVDYTKYIVEVNEDVEL